MVPNDEGTETETEPTVDEGGEPAGGDAPAGDGGDKTPVDKPMNRNERRASALKTQTDRADKWERDAHQALERAERVERDFNEFKRGQEERQRAGDQTRQQSQHMDKLKNLRSQWRTFAATAANAKVDATTRQEAVDRAEEIELEMSRLQHKMFREEEQASAPADDREQREAAAKEEQYLEARFPWLEGNGEAHGYAWSKFRSLIAAGRPPNRATMVEACTFIAAKFGFGGTNGNGTNGNSRRYAAVPGGEGAGGEESSRGGPPKTDNNYRLAMGVYPELAKEAAFSKWSKRMMEKRKAD